MDFSLTQEQALLQNSVAKYVRDHCDVERHRRLMHSELGFDADTWQEFAELGWLALPFREELGGLGGSAVDLMVMTEAMGRGLVREPLLTTVITCGGLLQCAGSPQQQDAWIGDIVAGRTQWAFAFAERGSGYDWQKLSARAERAGDDYLLSGQKIAVLNGHCADFLIVTAQTDEGLGLLVVDAALQGVSREAFTALDGSRGANVRFERVRVSAGQCLGSPGRAQDCIDRVMRTAIVAMGGEALGSMQALLNATVEYSKTREQFGQPIGKFQALQHRMADMFLQLEETRSLLFNAAILLDEDSDAAAQACAALKVKLADAGRYIAHEAVQLHGGIGMTDELSVGHHFKRLMLLGMLYGDADYHLERFLQLAS